MLFYLGGSGMYNHSNKVTLEQRPRREGVSYVGTGGKSIPGRGNSLYRGGWYGDQRGWGVEGEGDCGRRGGKKRPDLGNCCMDSSFSFQ